jgi:hypothetical protein
LNTFTNYETPYPPPLESVFIVVGILIAGGSPARSSTEVFLPGTGKSCALADLPDDRYYTTLDTVSGTGILCGGGGSDDTHTSCLQLNQTSGFILYHIP